MTILKYSIPKEFKISTNKIYSGVHWSYRKKIADYYHYLTLEDCKQLKQYNKKISLYFEFYFKTRALDSSNCSFMGKCLEDGLVKNGLIRDDTNKYISSVTYKSITLNKEEKKETETDYVRVIIN